MGIPLETDASLSPDQANSRLFDCIDALTCALLPDESISARLGRFSDLLAALADAANDAALPGLIDMGAMLADRISAVGDDPGRQETVCVLLAQLPLILMDYVLSPADPAARDALLGFLQSDDWQIAMADEEVDLLRMLLQSPADMDGEVALSVSETGLDEAQTEPDWGPVPTAPDACPTIAADGAESEELASVLSAVEFVLDTTRVQSVTSDMLALAVDAFEANYVGLQEALALAADQDRDRRLQGWEQLRDELDRMAGGVEAIGLGVLAQLLSGAHALLGARPADSDPTAASVLATLGTLPESLRGYLSAPRDLSHADAVVRIFCDLDTEGILFADRSDLAVALASVELAEPEIAEAERRPVVADAAEVSLALPEDINQELLEGLLTELPIQTSAFTDAVQRIASGHGRFADIEIAKRAAHTLKGAANTVGIKGIASLTHYLEDVLIELAEHSALPNLGLSQTLAYAADCLEGMSEALAESGQAPEDAVNVLQDVLNWANRIDAHGIEVAAADAADASQSAPSDEHLAGTQPPRQDHIGAPMLRVPTTLVDEQLRLVGESMTSTAQIQSRLQSAMQQVMAVGLQNRLLRQLVNELEDLVDLRGIALPQPVMANAGANTGFDALELDQYGELHTVTRRLVEVATDASEMTRSTQEHLNHLGDQVGLQTRLHLASQDAVLRARMVPVVSVVPRLQRAVRQAGRLLDKEVDLVLKGTDTLIDGNVLNELVDALMHVLRNAVDHGIEPIDARLAAGKDPVGHIELAFKREGDVITVTCRDDGQGLDLDRVRRVAQRRNLIGATDALSNDQVARLILAAGFSTRDEATQVSGRGIGLDSVSTMVESLKGSIGLHSEPGSGLTVEIRLPTTLLSAQALMIRLHGTVLAVATRGIEEIHFVTADQLQTVGSQVAYRRGDQIHDVVGLNELLNLGRGETAVRPEQVLLMVRMSSGACKAVVVEEIAESRSLVVKKLGPYVGRIGGVIGATILGDGGVAPVIDLPDLLRSRTGETRSRQEMPLPAGAAAADREQVRSPVGNALKALVVDDSISARRTTAQLFKDAGFEVQTAIDGLEAVAILDRGVPDVIMTDLEMPRMNGLELTAHVRAKQETRRVPIIMITSRSTEKHRQQAQDKGVDLYLTKPFSPDDLLRQVGVLAGR